MKRLLPVLQACKEFPRFYWKGRDSNKAYVGYGHNSSSPFAFVAQAFYQDGCKGVWRDFPQEWKFSPEHLISADWDPVSAPPQLPRCLGRKDTPTYEKWWHLVQDASQKIRQGLFTKVVLARQTTLSFDGVVDPLELLKGLMAFGNQTSLFLVQLSPEITFLGASPEKLFRRLDRRILTEALAGTISSSEKWSPKECTEIETVSLFLKKQLGPCCTDLQFGSTEERPFGSLRHLYQKLEGVLKERISDTMLIEKLHPTPALGGLPLESILSYLRGVEPIDRGWYGAPIGVVSEKETDLAIAIRSMIVCQNQIHLFSGSGIVKGSTPEREWEELDRKIAHVLRWCDE